jgi:hypothetical protein
MNQEQSVEQLRAENAELRRQLAERTHNRSGVSDDEEKLVRERIKASGGLLTREQAVECVRAQAAWDKHPANPNAV